MSCAECQGREVTMQHASTTSSAAAGRAAGATRRMTANRIAPIKQAWTRIASHSPALPASAVAGNLRNSP